MTSKSSNVPREPAKAKPRTRAVSAPAPAEVPKIPVMIVDDHPLFRAGLRRALEMEDDLSIVCEAADGQQALEKAREFKPRVILMDVNLPQINGLQATRELTAEFDSIAIIVLTAYHDDEQMLHAIKAGASAYFPKAVDAQELVRAIHEVAQSKYVVNDAVLAKPQVASWLLSQFEQMPVSGGPDAEFTFQPLSSREMEILKCITCGHSNKEIARLLGISRQTVKNHMTSILRKLAVNDRTQAAVYALRRGWIRLEDAH